jgi:uncharacterized cupredoxin-like copper-binding protein
MYFKSIAALVFATSILGLGACGASPNKTIAVTTTDSKFTPMSWMVARGQPVAFTLKNDGGLAHEWVLLKKGTEVTLPFDDDDEDKVYWEIEAEPGESKTASFTAPSEAGTYKVVCGAPAHLEQGMAATLVVN